MATFTRDLRFALRLLLAHPALAIVALATMALGIAANTVVFTVVHAVLLRPLPFAAADRLVQVATQIPSARLDRFPLSPADVHTLSSAVTSFEATAAWADGMVTFNGAGEPVSTAAAYATPDLLPLLGVRPLLGRTFDASEGEEMDPKAVVLGYELWRTHFGSDEKIVGTTVLADAMRVTVVGVMPPGFTFPSPDVQAWLPIPGPDMAATRTSVHFLHGLARLRPGRSPADARDEIGRVTAATKAVGESHVLGGEDHPVVVSPLKDEMTRHVRPALLLLQGAVAFVLLIACANVSSILLSLAESRSHEVSVRVALGATPRRLLVQFLTEAVLVGVLGGALGLLLSLWGIDVVGALVPDGAARAATPRIDGAALAFTLGTIVATSLAFGAAPALQLRSESIAASLGTSSPRATPSVARRRLRRALVVAEVAMAVVLLAGAFVTTRSFARLQAVSPGFDPAHLVTFEVEIPEKRYVTPEDVARFWDRFGSGVRAIPGVTSAAVTTGVPLRRTVSVAPVAFDDDKSGRTKSSAVVDYRQAVSPEFFATMGTPIVAGRGFEARDESGSEEVVIVNEAFAQRHFPTGGAVGQRIFVRPWAAPAVAQTVIGVVANTKQRGLDDPTGTEIIVPLSRAHGESMPRRAAVVVRSSADAATLLPQLRQVLGTVDPFLPISGFTTLDGILSESVSRPRFVATLLTSLAGLALVMAAIGIYGVTTHAVHQRTRELGIRLALGAPPRRLLGLILSQGVLLAGAGLAVGLAAAVTLNATLRRAFAALLDDSSSLDAATFVTLAVVTLTVSLVASYLPAVRATRIPPATALRGG